MTDEELIARLRGAPADGLGTENLCIAAADRIEALVKERDQWIEHTKNAVWSDSEELKLANSRAERLEGALRWYSDDPSSQGDVARTALKGDDHE